MRILVNLSEKVTFFSIAKANKLSGIHKTCTFATDRDHRCFQVIVSVVVILVLGVFCCCCCFWVFLFVSLFD